MHDETHLTQTALQARRRFQADVWAGLSRPQKSIPCQYFYDEAGSILFERITELPEY
ncbi:MAG: L-histidine N(alpha)-methyltransferase, partial [Gammaproteobacteria bacterium]